MLPIAIGCVSAIAALILDLVVGRFGPAIRAAVLAAIVLGARHVPRLFDGRPSA